MDEYDARSFRGIGRGRAAINFRVDRTVEMRGGDLDDLRFDPRDGLIVGAARIGDVAGKYYVPNLGAFVIYTIMIVVLLWRPQGLFARSTTR